MSQLPYRQFSYSLNDIRRICGKYGLILGPWDQNSDDCHNLITVTQYSPGEKFNVQIVAHSKDIAADRDID